MKWMTRIQFRGLCVCLICRLTQMAARDKNRKEGEPERDKELFHLKNEFMLQTQEGPKRTTEWDEPTKTPIISFVNRSVYPFLSTATLFFSSSPPPNQLLIVPLVEPVVLIRGLAQKSAPSTAPHTHTRAQMLNKHILI